ncbi:MAG TPA: DNA repair protein RecN [Puia sp.]|jgi:DNA repair protein RecN (Recombination protein N)|nr:DNA repair protein RecN [Puia sp.]
MLLKLHIQNYAIIEKITIDFSKGLQVITGETGAGKSIIAGALSLVLGERADTSILKRKDQKAVVEASFRVFHLKEVEKFLIEEELDREQELVLRREISAGGKSRAFVNDTPVNLDQLRRLCSMLVDLHQQFDILSLGEAGFQLAVVDALAANANILAHYHSLFHQLQLARTLLEQLKARQATADKEKDYHKFLFNELEEAGLKENEFEEAEVLMKRQSHSEAIKTVLTGIHFNLMLSDQPLVQQLRLSGQQLEQFRAYHEKFPEILQRLASVHIEMQDLAGEIESVNEDIQYDAALIEKLNERIHTGYKLFKKHNVSTTADLIKLREQLQKKLFESLDIAEEIHAKEKAVESLVKEATEVAHKLSVNRKAQTGGLEEKVNTLLKKVGMPNARIRVICSTSVLNEQGLDNIEFLFDANKSDRFEPLKKVASGGELSRLMLCIKSLVAQSMDMPTLLFDEIDSGISGEPARQVGIILKELSRKRQVICITHQPQIAGKGDAHFYVYKELQGDAVNTKIRLLDREERIIAIAKMLSGEKPTAAAMENARELVN